MNILVIHSDSAVEYPPVLSLCRDLLGLGHRVLLVAKGTKGIPSFLTENVNFDSITVGERPKGVSRVAFDFASDAEIKKICKKKLDDFDVVWTTTDVAARACGKLLFEKKHIMQLMELSPRVPLFSMHDMPLRSMVTEELARRAFHVVVPEYNRAFIQQAWWQIEKTPVVLPNKSLVAPDVDAAKRYPDIYEKFNNEKRMIILYQGVFTPDRDFTGCMAAMDLLGEEFALYLMGVREQWEPMLEAQRNGRDNVVLIPCVPAPNHLAFTGFGRIGLLPYAPSYARESPLNALYCAPNKIWEYSYFGLPMVGSQMPALKSAFDAAGMGVTTDFSNPNEIADSIRMIDANWNEISERSKAA